VRHALRAVFVPQSASGYLEAPAVFLMASRVATVRG
jgi:hypothetical protein